MKKIIPAIWIISILLLSIIIAGCNSNTYRDTNPHIILTADFQNSGSYTKNFVDVENQYLVTVNIFNNSNYTAKNVKIDQFSYCNNQKDFPFRNCINDKSFLTDIGDIKPKETKIRYYNFERPAWITVEDEKYNLTYRVSSDFSKVAPD